MNSSLTDLVRGMQTDLLSLAQMVAAFIDHGLAHSDVVGTVEIDSTYDHRHAQTPTAMLRPLRCDQSARVSYARMLDPFGKVHYQMSSHRHASSSALGSATRPPDDKPETGAWTARTSRTTTNRAGLHGDLRVHHDRAVPLDGLAERFARDQENANGLHICFDSDLIAVAPEHEMAVTDPPLALHVEVVLADRLVAERIPSRQNTPLPLVA
jgi:hypothetical protein